MASIKDLNGVPGASIRTIADIAVGSIRDIFGVSPPESDSGDAFANQVNNTEALAAWWSPNGAEAGDLADGATAMDLMSDGENPTIICTTASTGNWSIVADNISDEVESLKSSINSDLADASNFCAVDSGPSLSSDLSSSLLIASGSYAGFAFFKNNGANWDSANYGNIFQWYGDSDSTTAQMGTYNALGFYRGDAVDGTYPHGKVRMSTPQTLDMTGGNTMLVDTWYFIGWRQTSTGNFSIYVVAVGDVWSNADEFSGAANNAKAGLTLGMAMKGGGPQGFDGWRWGPLGFFASDIGESALQDIFEAIP